MIQEVAALRWWAIEVRSARTWWIHSCTVARTRREAIVKFNKSWIRPNEYTRRKRKGTARAAKVVIMHYSVP